jgi:hypothetical protein
VTKALELETQLVPVPCILHTQKPRRASREFAGCNNQARYVALCRWGLYKCFRNCTRGARKCGGSYPYFWRNPLPLSRRASVQAQHRNRCLAAIKFQVIFGPGQTILQDWTTNQCCSHVANLFTSLQSYGLSKLGRLARPAQSDSHLLMCDAFNPLTYSRDTVV